MNRFAETRTARTALPAVPDRSRTWSAGRSSASARRPREPQRRRGSAALDGVDAAARDGSNLVPPIIAAVEARATVGEIADAMRAVFGDVSEDGHRLMADSASAAASSDLTTVFDLPSGAVAGASTTSASRSAPGETLGLVGESGSGKSVTALSIMRLVQPPGRIARRPHRASSGRDLLTLDEREMRAVRGAEISLIFQEPMTALNPVFTIGDQIAETLLVHGRATRRDAQARKAIELLEAVRIPDAGARVDDYPHQLSGGMRQRVLIAMALAVPARRS